MKEQKKFMLDIDQLAAAIGSGATLDIWESSKGSGRNAVHDYYYLKVGRTDFREDYGYSCWGFAEEIATQAKAMEGELAKRGLCLCWEERWFECGGRDIWGCGRTDSLIYPVKAKKINLCKEFKDLQKWLEKRAGYNLSVFDIYTCQLCQKRSSKSLSGHCYLAEKPRECATALTALRNLYKAKNKITTEIVTEDYFDNGGYDHNRSEYEQYGNRTQYLKVILETPSGRNRKELHVGLGYC